MTPATELTDADRAAIQEARDKSPAALEAQIATLTGENKRLRALVEGAYKEGWADSALSPSDDLYIDWLNSTTRAALQPKEGEG